MKELYAALTGSVGHFIQSWIVPSALYVAIFTVALVPMLRDTWPLSAASGLSAPEQGLVIAFATLVVAILLAALARPLYRVLEGYHLPEPLRERWTVAQRARRAEHKQVVASATASHTQKQLAREHLDRYPRLQRFVMPTRLGNALKAGESYGKTHYGLDTVILWPHLTTVAPDKLLDQVTEAWAVVNTFTGALWLSTVFTAASLALAATEPSLSAALYGAAGAAIVPLLYRLALNAAAWYAKTLQALVDLARPALAESMGLILPRTLADEQELWTAVTNLAAWGPYWENSPQWTAIVERARTTSP